MTTTVGKPLPRIDARGKVTGEALYSGDLSLTDMLQMKILFAGRPHARVKWIDTTQAEAAPGVRAVYTSKDVPLNEYGLQWQDQPVLCGPVLPGPERTWSDLSAIRLQRWWHAPKRKRLPH